MDADIEVLRFLVVVAVTYLFASRAKVAGEAEGEDRWRRKCVRRGLARWNPTTGGYEWAVGSTFERDADDINGKNKSRDGTRK